MQLVERRLPLGMVRIYRRRIHHLRGLRVVPDLARLLGLVARHHLVVQRRVQARGIRERHHLVGACVVAVKLRCPLHHRQLRIDAHRLQHRLHDHRRVIRLRPASFNSFCAAAGS
ncbi:hypothetical protein G6F35_013725 [Rhizopus arrhizus]|nr:hypothetical protein G6F35_013725 [Rhizopus arrhizus]